MVFQNPFCDAPQTLCSQFPFALGFSKVWSVPKYSFWNVSAGR